MDISIYKTPLSESKQSEYEAFLTKGGLRDEGDSDFVAWMKDEYGRLVACGSLAKHTLKQFVVDPSIEGSGAMAQIMTKLIEEAYSTGNTRLFLCTKPKNEKMLSSLGFYVLTKIEDSVLMENRRDGLESFLSRVKEDADSWISQELHLDAVSDAIVRGAVVCNCDPFTLGHRHLIEYASEHCDFLYVFAVSESGSMFSPEDRLEMIRRGTADIPNCRVYESELYLVSRATFPAYFIRDEEHADEVKSDIDIKLFAERIAPALGITKRFVGQEPFSPVTNAYNQRMKQKLPESGIEIAEIPRFAVDNDQLAVSASRVRNLLKEGHLDEAEALLPPTSFEIIKQSLND